MIFALDCIKFALCLVKVTITRCSFTVQPTNGKSEDLGEQNCEGGAEQLPQTDEVDCEAFANSCLTTTDPAVSSSTACNGSVDSGLGTGCHSSFASGDRLALKTLTSSDKLSAGPLCSPVDEQQSPMSSTSSFLMPTPTTEEMCDDWSLMSDNKSEGGDTATGIDIEKKKASFYEIIIINNLKLIAER